MTKTLLATAAITLALGAQTALAQHFYHPEYIPRVSLETAIRNATGELSPGFRGGSTIAVVSVEAGTSMMADYLIDAMIIAFEDKDEFTVMSRSQLNLLRQGTAFPAASELSITMARSLGILLGADVVVTGAFEPFMDFYRFRVRGVNVRGGTAPVREYSTYVANDNIIALLLGQAVTKNLFTNGQRWGTLLLNIVPGLGSFTVMDDTLGGTVQAVAAGAGLALSLVGMGISNDNLLIGGIVLMGIQPAFNVIRSFSYLRSVRTILTVDPELLSVSFVPGANGIRVSRTIRF
ncbi:MAG: hypothetical protein FWB79_00295 [Treponema sp.]|nr:hypothetical protein [Treponema sp.]